MRSIVSLIVGLAVTWLVGVTNASIPAPQMSPSPWYAIGAGVAFGLLVYGLWGYARAGRAIDRFVAASVEESRQAEADAGIFRTVEAAQVQL